MNGRTENVQLVNLQVVAVPKYAPPCCPLFLHTTTLLYHLKKPLLRLDSSHRLQVTAAETSLQSVFRCRDFAVGR